jgi:serine/threonine-protein kinase
MKGKFGYMSPEQARGEAIDLRTDIFALGVVLWEAVCGRRLFHRENDLATMRALIYEQIPKPSSLVTVAPELEAVIMRALSRNPKFRFATAREMVAALEKYIVQAGGATASDLGALMKSYFAQDQAHWQQTVRTAINLPSEPDPAVTPATTAELGAAGSFSTGSVPVLGNTGTGTGPGTTGASRITGVVVGDGAPRPRKAFVLGAVGLAGAVAAAGVLLGLGMGRRPSSPATTPAPARAAAAPDVKNAPVAPVIVPTDPPAVPVPAAPAEVSPAEDDEAAAKKTLRRKKPALGGGRGAVSPPALNPGPQPVDRKVNPF